MLVRPLSAFGLVAILAALPLPGGTTVTIRNRSGHDLFVVHSEGSRPAPVQAQGPGDREPRPVPTGFELKSIRTREAESRVEPEPGPHPKPPATDGPFPLPDGGEATFWFREPGDLKSGLEAELVLYRLDPDRGVVLNGLAVLSLLPTRPGPGPDLPPEPEARLTLPSGPTPRTLALPANRGLRLVSDRELEIRPDSERAREFKASAVPPLWPRNP